MFFFPSGTIDMYLNSAQSSTDSSMCVSSAPMDVFSQANAGGSTGSIDSVSDLTNKMINANIYPPKSQLRRLKVFIMFILLVLYIEF